MTLCFGTCHQAALLLKTSIELASAEVDRHLKRRFCQGITVMGNDEVTNSWIKFSPVHVWIMVMLLTLHETAPLFCPRAGLKSCHMSSH